MATSFALRMLVGIQLRHAIDSLWKTRGVRGRELVPAHKRFGGRKAEGAAEIDHAKSGIEEFWGEFRRYFVRRGEKGGARCAGCDGFQGKGRRRSFAARTKLRKKLREAVEAVGFANIEGRLAIDLGMAEQERGELKTGIASDTNDGDIPRVPHFTWDSISFWRDSRVLRVGRDDEDGVITRDGAGDFRKFCAVDGGCEGLRATGRGLENEKIFRGANIQEEFAESAGKGRNGGGLIRKSRQACDSPPWF